MRDVCELFNIQNGQSRVGQRLAKHGLGVGLKGLLNLVLVRGGIDENALYPKLFEGHGEEIDRPAIDGRGRNKAVSRMADVQNGQKRRRLSA